MRPQVFLAAILCLIAGTCIAAGTTAEITGTPGNAVEVDRLIRDLGSTNFKTRDASERRLLEIGEPARVSLEKASRESGDLEVRSRSTALIERLERETAEKSLRLLIQRVCQTIVKDDFGAFKALVVDPDMEKKYGEKTRGETVFIRMKGIHAKEDYLKLFDRQSLTQKEALVKGEFTLGGHDYNHLHIQCRKEADGAWRIARFEFCR